MQKTTTFGTQNFGGEKYVTLEIDFRINDITRVLEPRYDHDPFKPRHNAIGLLKDLVRHIGGDSKDSLHKITERYSHNHSEYRDLLPHVAAQDDGLRIALADIASTDNTIGTIEFSQEDEYLVIQVLPLEVDHVKQSFDSYIESIREEGEHVPKSLDRLLEDWRSFNPDFHFRSSSVGGGILGGRHLDLPSSLDESRANLPPLR